MDEEDYLLLTCPLKDIILPNHLNLVGMDKSLDYIHSAIDNHEKIVIYGDYDCDGIMATSILVRAFKILNYDVGYYIPSRYIDGYGLTKKRIDDFKNKGYSLIITVDNGITLCDEIEYANSLNMKVIVTDHHELADKLPNAVSIIHPIISKLGKVVASGGAMAYYLATAMLGYSDNYLLSLAAISIISDLMELKDYNRNMVRLALDDINKKQYLQLLLLNNNETHFDENSFSMKIVPKINALGRILENYKTNCLVNYFTTDNRNEIYKIYKFIEEVNNERKSLTKDSYSELSNVDNSKAAIVVISTAKEGLIGLLAAKLLNDFNKPVIVFTKDDKESGQLKGSARSKKGFSIIKAFHSLDKYIIRCGGHALAGGLTIKEQDYEEFSKGFIMLAEKYAFLEESSESIEISLNDINEENYKLIRKFSPFGQGFKEPLFLLKNIKTSELKFMSQGKHISTPLSISSRLIGFNISATSVMNINFIDLLGSIHQNYYKNYSSIDFMISKIQKTHL